MSESAASPAGLPVLVIEDEPSVLAFVRACLERAGYAVVECASGVQALGLLERDSFLGVVSDMRTPGGVDGADVHAWITQHRPQLVCRVVFITGDTVNEDTAETMRRTGAPYLEKPFRVQQFLSIVEKTFGKPK